MSQAAQHAAEVELYLSKMESRMPVIDVVRLPNAEGLPLPAYETEGAAGMDAIAAVDGETLIKPGEWALIPLGIAGAIPEGHEVQIRPRSGLALRYGLHVHLGTLDPDYRGEWKALVLNLGPRSYPVNRGDRIAQLVMAPVVRAKWREVETLPDTARGAGGFGHTGIAA